jgi:ElaB/YqjD/DUF883 family membrane-anchored ribosome-binding protein
MTEALYNSPDVPDFDTYPSNQSECLAASGASGDSVLIQRAEQIGTVLGTAVSNLRKARTRLQELSDQTAEAAVTRISELADAAKAKAQEFSQTAAMRASELGDAVVQKAAHLGEETKAQYFRARRRANQMVRDYPVHTVLAAGVVGVLIGVGIRVWRAKRAY